MSNREVVQMAVWTQAFINTLPDSSFAYISPGGSKEDGKTTPRSLRHLPFKDKDGKPDAAHVRNALARLSQTDIPASAKASAKRKLQAAARSVGIEVGKAEMDVSDVYTETAASTQRCDDPMCDDPDCPTHGASVQANRRRRQQSATGDLVKDLTPPHAEPDSDEYIPSDYATRAQQTELWSCLWDKWMLFSSTLYDIIGDGDADNVPHLPILVDSIGQFQTDVSQLLEDCGVVAKAQPALDHLLAIAKAGAAMAQHRRQRLQEAIAALQQILSECTPDEIERPGAIGHIDRPGVSAAIAAGIPGYMKGATAMATAVPGIEVSQIQTTLDAVTKRAEEAEARVKDLEAQIASLDTTIAKMKQTPEEQEAEWLASLPEVVRKRHEADQAEKVELRKQLDEARAEREQTVYITKTADFRGFGMVANHWRILKSIDRGEPLVEEDRVELLRLMKSASERDATSDLYKAVGSEGRYGSNGMVESASASEQLMALTHAYMEDKGVQFLEASNVIAKSHPGLYERSVHERRNATRTSSR